MKHPYTLSTAAFLMLVSGVLGARGLEKTVSVSNDFDAPVPEFYKGYTEVSVPDSLLELDYNFDYSVFESPYKGSYDFTPYTVNMNPEASVVGERHFYMKAGAGYNFRPELDLVWSPALKGRTTMSVHDRFRGFAGNYQEISHCGNALGSFGTYMPGYEYGNDFAVDFRSDVGNSVIEWGGAYLTDAVGNWDFDRLRHCWGADVRFRSREQRDAHVFYDISLDYKGSTDLKAGYDLGENRIDARALIGPVINARNRLVFDVLANYLNYDGYFKSTAVAVSVGCRYRWTFTSAVLSLGGRLALATHNDADLPVTQFSNPSRYIYPDISFDWNIYESYIGFYAKAGGGDRLNTWSELVGRNPFLCPWQSYGNSMLELTNDRLDAAAGFHGVIAGGLSYDFGCAYRISEFAPVDCVEAGAGGTPIYNLCYADFNLMKAKARLAWRSDAVNAYAGFNYTLSNLDPARYVLPSTYSGEAGFSYCWRGRIGAGIYCTAYSDRTTLYGGEMTVLPGYVDLGADATYRYSSRLSFYVKGTNLLNKAIQRVPLYTTGGFSVLAGVVVNL